MISLYLCTRKIEKIGLLGIEIMKFQIQKFILAAVLFISATAFVCAAEPDNQSNANSKQEKVEKLFSRLSLGGYGEAVMTRNFYSDNIYRYTKPYEHKDDDGHGRFDLPHVVINLGYDFGHGWTMSSEIEFEHGGTESAVEMDADESGEYEAETEKGGEVALEQFWIQKSFCDALNIRAGEIIVPVGAANMYHMPNEFFTVYRPEGEASILPNTWHQTGLSVWGRTKNWRYEAQFLSGLDADRFGSSSFVHYGATSSYEFKIANTYAGALRLDNFSVPGLRLSLSGYAGTTFKNTLKTLSDKYDDVHGFLGIGAFDFQYKNYNWIVRGNFDWAHLEDASEITAFNKNFPTHSGQDGSPSKHQPVGSDAMATALEAGYDIFGGFCPTLANDNQKFFVFGRYEYYNSMKLGTQKPAYGWCAKNRVAFGINYSPVKEITIKAEYSERFFEKSGLTYTSSNGKDYPLEYNNEPSISIGITYYGWFK